MSEQEKADENGLSASEMDVLRAIREGRPVGDEQANWAVKLELATKAWMATST